MAAKRVQQKRLAGGGHGNFRKNVFVNCAFDKEYVKLLRPLLFTIIYLGLTPRISLESKNSGAPRIEKIVKLIREPQYSIHDLSRSQAKKGELFRLNMPFEFGVGWMWVVSVSPRTRRRERNA